MPGCCAVDCKNRSEQGYKMKVFPRDPKRRKLWSSNVNRQNWEPTNHSYLCEVHFDEDQWEKISDKYNRKIRKIKKDAVPTIFSHSPNGIRSPTLDCHSNVHEKVNLYNDLDKGKGNEQNPDSTVLSIVMDLEVENDQKPLLPLLSNDLDLNEKKPNLTNLSKKSNLEVENKQKPNFTIMSNNLDLEKGNQQKLNSTNLCKESNLEVENKQKPNFTTMSNNLDLEKGNEQKLNSTNLSKESNLEIENKQKPNFTIMSNNLDLVKGNEQKLNSTILSNDFDQKIENKQKAYLIVFSNDLDVKKGNEQKTNSTVMSNDLDLEKRNEQKPDSTLLPDFNQKIKNGQKPVLILPNLGVGKVNVQNSIAELNKQVISLLKINRDLAGENRVLKQVIEKQNCQIRNYKEKMINKKSKHIAKKIFNDDQLKALTCDHGFNRWSDMTLETASTLYFTCGERGYKELLRLQYPLPSLRTCQRWREKMKKQKDGVPDS